MKALFWIFVIIFAPLVLAGVIAAVFWKAFYMGFSEVSKLLDEEEKRQ